MKNLFVLTLSLLLITTQAQAQIRLKSAKKPSGVNTEILQNNVEQLDAINNLHTQQKEIQSQLNQLNITMQRQTDILEKINQSLTTVVMTLNAQTVAQKKAFKLLRPKPKKHRTSSSTKTISPSPIVSGGKTLEQLKKEHSAPIAVGE